MVSRSWCFGLVFAIASPLCCASEASLIDAIRNGQRKAALQMIESGTGVNVRRPDGATPLAVAAYLDDTDLVDHLIKAGADVNLADEYGETPLTLACVNGNAAIVKQ